MSKGEVVTPTTIRFNEEELRRLDALVGESRSQKLKSLLNQKSAVDSLASAQNKPLEAISLQVQMLSNLIEKNGSQAASVAPAAQHNDDALSKSEFRIVMSKVTELLAYTLNAIADPKSAEGKNVLASKLQKEIVSGAFGDIKK